MANSTAVELQSDFLTCPICCETFKNPKYLPCSHTFCQGCIHTLITSDLATTSAKKQVGISCPICRQFITKPTNLDSNNWASRLPSNQVVSSLLELKKATDKPSLCSACERENKTESATSWCVNCSEALCDKCVGDHRKFNISTNHEITTIENLELDMAAIRKRDIFCQTHKDEIIKAYCTDHSAVCCMSCVMLSHRKCDDVSPIEDAADVKRKSSEISELEKSLSDMGREISSLLKENQTHIAEFRESLTDAKNKVKDVRRRLETILDKMEKDCLERLSQIEKETLTDLENQQADIQGKQSVLQNDVSIFKNSVRAPDAVFLSEFDKISKQKMELQTFVEDCHSKSGTRQIVFEEDEKVKQFETAFPSFGTMSVTDDSARAVSTSMSPGACLDISTATSRLSKSCNVIGCVTGVAFSDDDSVVASINTANGNRLKLFNRDLVLQFELSLPYYPWMIRMHSHTEGSVVVYDRFIQKFSVNGNKLVDKGRAKLKYRRDFVQMDSKYCVGGVDKIIVYNLDATHDRDISVVGEVYYMAVRDKNSLCYTVPSKNAVHCITTSGVPVFTYTHRELKSPQGIHIDQSRHIYVCGYRSKNIHQLTNDGRLQRIVIKDIPTNPYSISLSPNTNRLVVGASSKIVMYEFS